MFKAAFGTFAAACLFYQTGCSQLAGSTDDEETTRVWQTRGFTLTEEPSSGAMIVGGDIYVTDRKTSTSATESPIVNAWEYAIIRRSTDGGATWTNTFDTQGGSVNGVLRYSDGQLFLVGSSLNFLISQDQGATWEGLGSLANPFENIYRKIPYKIAEGPNKNLYVIGTVESSDPVIAHMITWKSTDGGLTWTVVDDFQISSAAGTFARDVAVNSNNVIFVMGWGFDDSSGERKHRCILRKSSDDGTTWTTAEEYEYISGSLATACEGLGTDNSGGVYVVGNGYDAATNTGSGHWFVRKSTDDGATWTNIDDYQKTLSSGTSSGGRPQAIKINTNGDIYVVGSDQSDNQLNDWVVRRSTDNGTTWENIDLYVPYSGDTSASSQAWDIHFASNGDIWVAGEERPGGGTQTWIWVTRKSTDGGTTWTTVDQFTGQ